MAEYQKINPPPYVPGMDAAGIVDQLGEGVETDIKVGDEVMAMVVPSGNYGAYREQIVLDQNAVVRAPRDTSHVEACTLPMNSLTARLSLDLLGLKEGQVLAVTGSPGAYGGYVVQLAKADGLTVIADSNESDEELLKSLGVDIIIPRGEGYAETIRQQFPNGVDGIADGALLNELAIDAVKDGGSFTSIRGFKGKPQREIDFTTTWVTAYDCKKDILENLRQQTEEGILTLRVADTVDTENASEAHRRLEAGGTRGRMVIKF
jgi:NADPH:quinone reductase-like Zn-dependent oxidoreductase